MTKVIDNLKEAINGESNAIRKYELFAEQANKENLPEIAHLFTAVAFAESVHVKNHFKALSIIKESDIEVEDFVKINEDGLKNRIKDTRLNLIEAIKGETYETKKMYKRFVKDSKTENSNVTELTFILAQKAEKVHARIFSDFLKKLIKAEKINPIEIYVCQICGNIEFKEAPAKCVLCDHAQIFFKKV